MLELPAHHVRRAVGAAQGGLVEHRPELRGVRLREQLLPGHPQLDPLLDLVAGSPTASAAMTARAYSSVWNSPGTNCTW